jgi:hypothetical protein
MRFQSHHINDPDYWRDWADQIRVLAADIRDKENKARLLRLAADYEELGDQTAKRSTDIPRIEPSSWRIV